MSADQLILIGLIASAITWGLKVLASYGNYKPSRVVVNIGLYVVSATLALLWSGAVFPSFPLWAGDVLAFAQGLWDFLNQLMALAAPVIGSATLIYNLLYEKVFVPAARKFTKK